MDKGCLPQYKPNSCCPFSFDCRESTFSYLWSLILVNYKNNWLNSWRRNWQLFMSLSGTCFQNWPTSDANDGRWPLQSRLCLPRGPSVIDLIELMKIEFFFYSPLTSSMSRNNRTQIECSQIECSPLPQELSDPIRKPEHNCSDGNNVLKY